MDISFPTTTVAVIEVRGDWYMRRSDLLLLLANGEIASEHSVAKQTISYLRAVLEEAKSL